MLQTWALFEHDYPSEYAAYVAANREYNANEAKMAELAVRLEAEATEVTNETTE